jgi:hypothetical protein
MNSWILLLYGLPTKQNAGRVQLWRKLRKFGALQLKTSAYVLPDEPVHHERFQWLATQIRDDGGEATLIRVSEIEGMPHDQIVQLFNDARGKEYTELVTELSEFVRSNRKKVSDAYSDDLEKLQVRFKELRETDYFNCPKGQDAQMLLRDAEGLGRKKKSGAAPRLQKKNYLRRKWLTRPRPEGDRVASAWLIRKFIDPEAAFVFAASTRQHRDAIPYDMFDAEFSHHGDDCTFETLAKRFVIDDAGVAHIAEMIHDADLEDGKFKRYEGIGIDRVLKGWAKQGRSDDEILAKGMELIDALYATMKR